jgi:hypothetical protein
MALKQAVDPKGIIEIDPFGIKKNVDAPSTSEMGIAA